MVSKGTDYEPPQASPIIAHVWERINGMVDEHVCVLHGELRW